MRDPKELNILLAEDNRINQRFAVLTFGQMGVLIDIAYNGQEALDMFCQTLRVLFSKSFN
jgi:CheY-like chemotaxis protein